MTSEQRDWSLGRRLAHRGWVVTPGWLSTPCWIVNGSKHPQGYGAFKIAGRTHMAHRVAYREWVGPIPEDQPHIRHRCDNPPCINPEHLIPGTHQDNMRDREERQRRVPARGARDGNAKLDEEKVLDLRSLAAEGCTSRELALQFGVSTVTVNRIISRRGWTHI